jgi:hypothetical protein
VTLTSPLPQDGTLTAAIQSGIPVTIDPSSLTGPVAINQVFVPIYSNTEKGPIIELVPIKTGPRLATGAMAGRAVMGQTPTVNLAPSQILQVPMPQVSQ